jgi:hypothetical protein
VATETGEVAAHMAKFCPEIEMKYAVRGEEGMSLIVHLKLAHIYSVKRFTPNRTHNYWNTWQSSGLGFEVSSF